MSFRGIWVKICNASVSSNLKIQNTGCSNFRLSAATDFAARMSTAAMCDLHFSWSTTADNRKFEHPVFCIFKFDDTLALQTLTQIPDNLYKI
jgi:hypothetical protein